MTSVAGVSLVAKPDWRSRVGMVWVWMRWVVWVGFVRRAERLVFEGGRFGGRLWRMVFRALWS